MEPITPFEALMGHPVGEVRSALAHGGMDLDAFDRGFVLSFLSLLRFSFRHLFQRLNSLRLTLILTSHLSSDVSQGTRHRSDGSFGSSFPRLSVSLLLWLTRSSSFL